uniref:pyridoxal kinase n=1 Tax=Ditylum brightwellii TaxID=49249 RepID=A0A7S1VZ37_9STRA|mmetsp:Transcript_10625/g.15781  ORF Transcript_10625/g.15781 Transcript_10625/m.15781 type:complete len:322 (+) Transcript_10625:201-1166(+)
MSSSSTEKVLNNDLKSPQRVLSIQSHVVSGYVGNKAAVFPLQLLGFDVDVINSVHFSNHTGHPGGIEGDVLGGDQLKSIVDGLERNGLLRNIGNVLTGYIGSESFLRAIINLLKTVRSNNTDSTVRYVCDPVLGDNGEFYVPPELVSIYREELVPLANVVTPNQFEVEQLTGIRVRSICDAKKACKALHDIGPELVVITSAVLDTDDVNKSEEVKEKSISIIASKNCNGNSGNEVWCINSPILSGQFTGTGDLFAALLLGWSTKDSGDLPSTMEKVVGTMYSVIKRTAESSGDTVASRELKLVQSKEDIERPPMLFKARRI